MVLNLQNPFHCESFSRSILKILHLLRCTTSKMVKVGMYGLEHTIISLADLRTQLFSVPAEALAR